MKRLVRASTLVCVLAVSLWQYFPVKPTRPIPLHIDLDTRKVELGEKLFHDPQLSRNDTISCASCRDLETGDVDRKVTSVGSTTPVTFGMHFEVGF